MLNRRPFLAAAGALLAASPTLAAPARAAAAPAKSRPAWAQQVPAIRIGELDVPDNAERLTRLSLYTALMEKTFSVPVRLDLVADYNSLVNGFVQRRLDLGYAGPAVYAAAWMASDHNVVPLVKLHRASGADVYRSVMVVRADSDIHSLADMQGRSVAWGDPGSASGYLMPRASFVEKGIDTDQGSFFSRTTFVSGRMGGVDRVLSGEWDASFTRVSGDGDPTKGGSWREMMSGKHLDPSKLRVIWVSAPLPNGPVIVRADTPAGFRDDMRAFHLSLGKSHPKVMAALRSGAPDDAGIFVPVRPEEYTPVLQLVSAAHDPGAPMAGEHADPVAASSWPNGGG